MNVSLKKAASEDIEFLYELHKKGLKDCVERQFGVWDEERQRSSFMAKINPEKRKLIMYNRERIGAFGVRYGDYEIYLEYIVILPEYQKQGIGTYLIKQITSKADEQRKPVKLGVLKSNKDAYRLYSSLGFKTLDETEAKFIMYYNKESSQ